MTKYNKIISLTFCLYYLITALITFLSLFDSNAYQALGLSYPGGIFLVNYFFNIVIIFSIFNIFHIFFEKSYKFIPFLLMVISNLVLMLILTIFRNIYFGNLAFYYLIYVIVVSLLGFYWSYKRIKSI